ncbi:unnamed protein product [Sympodiomycopsis kandeliae]
MEANTGHVPGVNLECLLGNTTRGELATAWQFGKGYRSGMKETTRRIKERSRLKATETPGATQPSARGQYFGLFCHKSNSSPSSRSFYTKNPSKVHQHPALRHSRARMQDGEMPSAALCHVHRIEHLWHLSPRLSVKEAVKSMARHRKRNLWYTAIAGHSIAYSRGGSHQTTSNP